MKAFDVCSHKILLKKLEKMGIGGNSYAWFKNYLSGRTQLVDINGSRSEALNIDISVIQGSILGPILFLCYINDFYAATTLFSVLFADDTTGLGKGKNLRDLTTYMNSELQKIANWFRSNKMAINTTKPNSLYSGLEERESTLLIVILYSITMSWAGRRCKI
jgi:ribonuclease P/MRP protein subunit RPP40